MIQKESQTAITEVWMNEERNHRYLFKKTWEKGEKVVLVLTIQPAANVPYVQDLTTMLVEKKVQEAGYQGYLLVNLFSKISQSTTGRNSKVGYTEETMDVLKTAVAHKELVDIIIAVGSIPNTNQVAMKQLQCFYELLSAKQQKGVKVLVDEFGKSAHPLAPKMRHIWQYGAFQDVFKEDELKNEIEKK